MADGERKVNESEREELNTRFLSLKGKVISEVMAED